MIFIASTLAQCVVFCFITLLSFGFIYFKGEADLYCIFLFFFFLMGNIFIVIRLFNYFSLVCFLVCNLLILKMWSHSNMS